MLNFNPIMSQSVIRPNLFISLKKFRPELRVIQTIRAFSSKNDLIYIRKAVRNKLETEKNSFNMHSCRLKIHTEWGFRFC